MNRPTVTFYPLAENQQRWGAVILDLLLPLYRSRNRVYIVCSSEQEMLELDENLWQLATERFIAHALDDEDSAKRSPVVLGRSSTPRSGRFSHWFNLTETHLTPLPDATSIIEFVPAEDAQKALARTRFRGYCELGVKPLFNEAHQINA